MTKIRLYNLSTALLEPHPIHTSPPYIAISHAWSDHIFATGLTSSFGGTAIHTLITTRYPSIRHVWIDNFCIKQDDDADKAEQIPLMGAIYRRAEVVAIVLTTEFDFDQAQVDAASVVLRPVLQAWREETFGDEAFMRYWREGRGRGQILAGMRGLARLTRASWGTRIWTLQEFILATNVIWIGSDLNPVVIDDMLFQALPGICEQLCLEECLSRDPDSEFAVLYTHFSGMANSRLGALDRTRTMELLGNRKATVAVDEIYGIMAACGVEIEPTLGESREEAWERWWQAAVQLGHVRWILLPPITAQFDGQQETETKTTHCLLPSFANRANESSASYLDSVATLGAVTVSKGTVTLPGRIIGTCTLLRKLGRVYTSQSGTIHRDITLIMFARGRWADALRIVEAFGSTRYTRKQQICLAQVLVDNYRKARRYLRKDLHVNTSFAMRSRYQNIVWKAFMQLQCGRMDGLNLGTGFLARISSSKLSNSFLTVIISGEHRPRQNLVALDFEAVTGDDCRVLLIAELPPHLEQHGTSDSASSLHKVGTTIPIPVDAGREWSVLSLEQISLGGSRCHVCAKKAG